VVKAKPPVAVLRSLDLGKPGGDR